MSNPLPTTKHGEFDNRAGPRCVGLGRAFAARRRSPCLWPVVAGWACLTGALTVVGCASTPTAGPSTRRPNILFALADDQSWLHTGFGGDTVVRTPAFDRVASEGVYFTHSFSACPSCTPSRSAILSGQDIWRVGAAGVLYGSIPKDLELFPSRLEDAGYHVGYTGKGWVPGNAFAQGLERDPIGREYNDRQAESVPDGIDVHDYAANFDAFLADRPAGVPFFFWFGCKEPHRVYDEGAGVRAGKKVSDVALPDFFPDADLIRSDILDYYTEIEWFDRHLGRMVARLEEIGELDDTLIVVTSDNGMPFPRCKTTLYDWGVRMPLAIRWGRKMRRGRVIDDFVGHTDFAPTFLEAAGRTPPPRMTGRSLLPILLSDKQGIVEPGRDHVVTAIERHTWCRPNGATYPVRAIRTREYLYIRNFEPDRWPTGGPTFVSSNKTFHGDVDACPTKTFMVANPARHARAYALGFGKRPLEELYAIAGDPGQTKNLADDPAHAAVKGELWARLRARLVATRDPRLRGEDVWQDIVYHQTTGYGATFNRSLPEADRRRARERGAHKPE